MAALVLARFGFLIVGIFDKIPCSVAQLNAAFR